MALGERLTGSFGSGPVTTSSAEAGTGFRLGSVFITHRIVISLCGIPAPTELAA
jgi:hypothetical protein